MEEPCTFDFPWTIDPIKESPECDQETNEITERGPEAGFPDAAATWMVFSKGLSIREVTMKLLRDSWCLLKQLRLEHWVEVVLEKPPVSVVIFESYLEKLSFSLFNFLHQFPLEKAKYHSITASISSQDYFLSQALSHALSLSENGTQFQPFRLEAGFITEPLACLLARHDKHILLRLDALEARFRRYRASPEMLQGKKFIVDTSFLDVVLENTATSIAADLSRDAYTQFSRMTLECILLHDEHLQLIGSRWNQLCHDAEDLASVESLVDKLMALAKELHDMKNFHSLSAILRGLTTAGVKIEAPLAEFADATMNYRRYRTRLHSEPSLPFLYPLVIEFRRGSYHALLSIFSFLLYDPKKLERLRVSANSVMDTLEPIPEIE